MKQLNTFQTFGKTKETVRPSGRFWFSENGIGIVKSAFHLKNELTLKKCFCEYQYIKLSCRIQSFKKTLWNNVPLHNFIVKLQLFLKLIPPKKHMLFIILNNRNHFTPNLLASFFSIKISFDNFLRVDFHSLMYPSGVNTVQIEPEQRLRLKIVCSHYFFEIGTHFFPKLTAVTHKSAPQLTVVQM